MGAIDPVNVSARGNYGDGMIRVYKDEICKVIDNYNGSAYYEPLYVITRANHKGGF